jgi:hypothetical protein
LKNTTKIKRGEQESSIEKYSKEKTSGSVKQYDQKFSEMRIDETVTPQEYNEDQIKEYYEKQSETHRNKYYIQSKEKSRIIPAYLNDTEMMGSIATERAMTQADVNKKPSIPTKKGPPGHKRKQSANIPYKMSIPRANIGNLTKIEKSELIYEPNNCHFVNNNDFDNGDNEEECNVGEEAEEWTETTNQKDPKQSYPNKALCGYDRHFRSSTTKSNTSSVGPYKQTESVVNHVFSTEDDDDNFLTLEWDENLYEDVRLNDNFEMEEEKIMVNPTRVKQSFEDFNKNCNVEMKEQKETVNDTIPDFGFVSKQENTKPKVKENKVVIKKNPSEGTYFYYLLPQIKRINKLLL